jgi:hypothetical protein
MPKRSDFVMPPFPHRCSFAFSAIKVSLCETFAGHGGFGDIFFFGGNNSPGSAK